MAEKNKPAMLEKSEKDEPVKTRHEIRLRGVSDSTYRKLMMIEKNTGDKISNIIKVHLPKIIEFYGSEYQKERE